MFPLGTVLFPHMVLPLHVFEPRYRVLMHDCTRAEGAEPEFGVVLIERGREVGGADDRFGAGTLARIVEAAELPDGRWVLSTLGTRRIAVDEWLAADPYPLAMVRELEERPWSSADDTPLAEAERLVRRALALVAELGRRAVPATVALAEDPDVAAWQLVAIAPLGPLDRQGLLEAPDHGSRLDALSTLVEEEISVLAYRLGRG
jgi:Lon protease-like protein